MQLGGYMLQSSCFILVLIFLLEGAALCLLLQSPLTTAAAFSYDDSVRQLVTTQFKGSCKRTK